ncbi:MAG: SixA phosphatase family protein [Parvibaculales bacterium]
MVKLLLWRHAKTVHQDGLPDIDRFLTSRGRAERHLTARRIETTHPPDIIICSVANRTRETLDALAADVDPLFSELLYHCYVEDILDIAQGIDDAHQTLLLVGHNPGFEDFVRQVQANDQPHAAQLDYKFYPGDLAVIEWSDASWGGIQMKDAVLSDIFSVRKKPSAV